LRDDAGVGLAPKTEFVARGDSHLAYQVFGTGNARVLMLYGVPSHLDYFWDFPVQVRVHERLALLARVAVYDWRGYGMSDPLPQGGYSIEELAADALTVMDAAQFERAVLWGDFTGGAVAVWLAVHHPTRVDGLILVDSFARIRADVGYDIGFSDAEIAERRAVFHAAWGTGASIELVAPSLASDEHMREQWARYERLSCTPTAMVNSLDVMTSIDVRSLLSEIAVPTLVVHSATNVVVPVVHGRFLAEHIPGARYVEVETDEVFEWTTGGVTDEVAEFVTGTRTAAHVHRSLQVLLFADIVESTNRAAAMGDDPWRDLLSDFRNLVRTQLDRYGGREISTRGDDFFAVAGSPSVAVEIARAIKSAAATLGLQVRCGIHLGEVEQHGGDFTGIAVHIAARIAARAEPDEILVSQTVRDALIGSGVVLASRGAHDLKGVPDQWHLFALQH
jgi:pimeloyl-ACP methyl ester carboxylesterase